MSENSALPAKDERSRNARAQARHRAKRKAYVEQLEFSLKRLQNACGFTIQDLDRNTDFKPPAHRIRELEAENHLLKDEIKTLRDSLVRYESQDPRLRRTTFQGAEIPQANLPEVHHGHPSSNNLFNPHSMPSPVHDYRPSRPSLSLPPPQPGQRSSFYSGLQHDTEPMTYSSLQGPPFRRLGLEMHSPASGHIDNSSASSPLSPHSPMANHAPPASGGSSHPPFYPSESGRNQYHDNQPFPHHVPDSVTPTQSTYVLNYEGGPNAHPQPPGWHPDHHGHGGAYSDERHHTPTVN